MLRPENPSASATDRLEMCALSLDDLSDELQEKVVLVDMEVRREGATYSVDTLGQLKAFFPHDTFTFILGSDAATRFNEWKRAADIKKGAEILVVKRPGAAKSEFPEIEIAALDISATAIREVISRGGALDGLVSPSVARYITERRLYGRK